MIRGTDWIGIGYVNAQNIVLISGGFSFIHPQGSYRKYIHFKTQLVDVSAASEKCCGSWQDCWVIYLSLLDSDHLKRNIHGRRS
jgi:hypothetical protein